MDYDLAKLPDDTTALKGMLTALVTSHTDQEKENQIKQALSEK